MRHTRVLKEYKPANAWKKGEKIKSTEELRDESRLSLPETTHFSFPSCTELVCGQKLWSSDLESWKSVKA